jgi:uncharacterized membrane-anchored protein YhcB (DUF1043 family)
MSDEVYTLKIKSSHIRWALHISLSIIVLILLGWVIATERSIHAENESTLEQLQLELEECREEATAWYNSSTALSEAIVDQAMRGGLATSVNTDIALAFAIEGHELKCIQPRIPTG